MKTSPSGSSSFEVMNLLHLLFTAIGVVFFVAGVAVLGYEAVLFVMGQGWTNIPFGAALDWLFGPPPAGELSLFLKAVALLALAPLPLVLMGFGFISSKIGDFFEKRS